MGTAERIRTRARERRKELGLTQDEVARMIGVMGQEGVSRENRP